MDPNILSKEVKMKEELFCLKLNNHHSIFFDVLAGLRNKAIYADATLACDGEFFPVHKLVMSSCSDYFSDMFEQTSCKNPIIVLKDVKQSDLTALLDYIYIGEVNVRKNDLASLIRTAKCLRIKGLADPDEDLAETTSAKKIHISKSKSLSNCIPEHRKTSSANVSPSPKRQKTDNIGGSSPYNNQNISFNVVSPLACNTNNSSYENSEPRQLSMSIIKDGEMFPDKPPSPEFISVDQIKLEVNDSVEEGRSSNISQLDHTGGSEHEDDSSGEKNLIDFSFTEADNVKKECVQLFDKSDQLVELSAEIPSITIQDDIKNKQHDQLAGPSGLQEDITYQDNADGNNIVHSIFSREQMVSNPTCIYDNSSLYGGNSVTSNDDKNVLLLDNKNVEFNMPKKKNTLECNLCSYSTPHHANLIRHKRIHTGEKPFKCAFCNYSASCKSTLLNHERRHTGEKPYKCELCNFSAKQLAHLIYHKRTNACEKNFKFDF